jgi:hypothetical protein
LKTGGGVSEPPHPPCLVSIYDGRTCIGFILARGPAGYEAFTANDERSLGVFVSIKLAADAVSDAAASRSDDAADEQTAIDAGLDLEGDLFDVSAEMRRMLPSNTTSCMVVVPADPDSST